MKALQIKTIAIGAILLFISFDICALVTNSPYALTNREPRPVVEPGSEFNDFKQRLAGVNRVGFLTNKDLSPERNDGQFLAAQYILAPAALELNNPDYPLLLLDCKTPFDAPVMAQDNNANIILVNIFGKVLAEKKKR